MGETFEDNISNFVAENGLNGRTELLKGDGWSLQLVPDGYFGSQESGRDYFSAINVRPCNDYDDDGWVCTRPVDHTGPHIASINSDNGESMYISVW